MKRGSEDLSSLYTSSSSTGTSPTTACSQKSLKRLKLENEIFSKSIKDIEKMFAPPQSTRAPQAVVTRRPSCDQYLPESTTPGKYNYDCINVAFLPNQRSPTAPNYSTQNNNANSIVPVLPSQRQTLKPKSIMNKSPLLYLDFDLYEPEVTPRYTKENLEQELNLIDQLVLLH
ncbi:uncharacterized protein CANTADRAFT_23763 [Suhomyces tanzawaensis NRRL Y-17324]|uniref:Uncharacterized protein n=1 Tax=Suhomyces tanzawaensis NRRL Y-17324 TaxID=984487 RepID=A0A1E4SDR4_9ASCO|nr:uncharacterized protein CANTADRAFT_23763 [Suhomyces tanzawaensis NRRL Y-17324]ODV77660.1 hypothetical protein CANTADRAFT_23763 [Suhomyces tanzawaensis NRRL Y-17324]